MRKRRLLFGMIFVLALWPGIARSTIAADTDRRFPDIIVDEPGRAFPGSNTRPFPATLLLQALGLTNAAEGRRAEYVNGSQEIDDPRLRQFAKEHGLTIRALHVPSSGQDSGVATAVLRIELADRETFHLLYSSPGCLLAVFPAMEAGEDPALARWKYFDLSPYYFEFPQRGSPDAWARFATLTRQRRDLIRAYKEFLHLGEEVKPAYGDGRKPWVRVSINSKTNRIDLQELDPEEWLESRIQSDVKPLLSGRSDLQGLIFPVFPTVYSPANPLNAEQDVDFGNDVHQVMQRMMLRTGDSVLDIGTGSGYLAWLAWATARRAGAHVKAFTLDINPIAVANSRVLAQLAGYPLTSRVYDNVISRRGEYAFPGHRFRYVIWNMPAVAQTTGEQGGSNEPYTLADYWDGGGNGVDALERFAPAVAGLFDPEIRRTAEGRESKSTAIIWNLLTPKGRDLVGPAFRREGLEALLLEYFFFRDSTSIIYVLTAPSGS